ncbi:MAG TPA: proton-conducting membrane transporter [Lachnoclostridium sp.]|nr:proton-conducting membrane transporter [Lachnoclostridium sp.]
MSLIIAILFPAIAGIIVSVFRPREKVRNTCYTVIVLLADVLCILALRSGEHITFLTLSENLHMAFAPDRLGTVFLAAVMILYTAVCFYSFEYMKMEERVEMFFTFYFLSFTALIAVCLASNLLTLYFCFEMLTLLSMPMVLHELTKDAVSAGLKYLFYSIAGALMGLLAVFFVYYFTSGNAEFVKGGFLDPAKIAGRENLMLIGTMIGISGFGTKAGLYPMHGWLPTAHPIAPAPASSLLSGIIAKAGVIAVIRLVYYSVGTDLIRGTWVQYAWMTLAMLTIFMGSMMAYREHNLKKRLAYSTVSQISYILLSLSFLSEEGMQGALLHVLSHASSKGCLFLCAGVLIYKLGKRRVEELKGVGKLMPVTMLCFTVASLSLVGIPPMGGFLSKWVIAQASLHNGLGLYAVLPPVILLISALLTAGYLLTVVVDAFFPGGGFETEEKAGSAEPSPLMTVPMICLCFVALAVGIFGGNVHLGG